VSGHLTREVAIELHCQSRQRLGFAASTIALEARLLRALLPRLLRPLAKVRPEHVQALLGWRNTEVSRDMAARELNTLKVMFATLVEEGLLKRNPAAELTLTYTGVRASPPLVLTEEAVE
jgi:site-specific recombinase XerD